MAAVASEQPERLSAIVAELGRGARAAAGALAVTPAAARDRALRAAAAAIRREERAVLLANERDLAAAAGLSEALRDRLALDPKRIAAMAAGLAEVAAQPDPLDRVLARFERPNGLLIERKAVPIGVIAIIYESRPNVTADAGALCLKSGNAAILRGGSESFFSSAAILACLQQGLAEAGLPRTAIQAVPTTDRAAVGELLRLAQFVDLVVPRGGKGLIERVQQEARMPVLAHLEGLNHSYIHAAADAEKARRVVFNAKLRRVAVCGATETILCDRAVLASHLKPLLQDLLAAGCEVRGDAEVRKLDSRVKAATEADWSTEYLAPIVSVRAVSGLDEALAHIARYGTRHTEAILTEDKAAAERFLAEVDAAIVLLNASTQFADGGEFGMGAEIGIATGKLPPRGPVGANELTSYKYVVRGDGQIRDQ
jgi:glutamate-5-semialdehyde dehydrogenase